MHCDGVGMITSKGRPLDYLRVSLTPKCNFNCIYCMPDEYGLPGTDQALSSQEWVRLLTYFITRQGIKTIRFTGGEPLLSPQLEPILEGIRPFDIDSSVTTNAFLLEAKAEKLKMLGLKRLNISLDTLDANTFKRISARGNLAKVLRGIEKSMEVGFERIKINSLLLRGINDSECVDLVRWAMDRDLEIRFMELMSIGVMSSQSVNYRITTHEVHDRLSKHFMIRPTKRPKGSPATTYRLTDPHTGRTIPFGLISPVSDSFCSDCRRLRINYKGELIPCLMHDSGLDLKPLARGQRDAYPEGLHAALMQCADQKPWSEPIYQAERLMTQIGG
ncbi:MAG: GTP 3',8-cyclase MoaA [Acidobacteria bacterium]|nr:MAG: GTP 3',8-cyclase MoaA [Acidobacteriota bacterium]